jgi:hypothetical protein
VIFEADWSPDGSLIASTDDTGSVRIWDPATGQEVNRFNVGFAPLFIDWSPDGMQMLISGTGSHIPEIRRVWQSTEDLVSYAKECCVFRELTPEERQQFGLPPVEGERIGRITGSPLAAMAVVLGTASLTIGFTSIKRKAASSKLT